MYKNNKNIVRTNKEDIKKFEVKIGVKKAYVPSPLLLSIVLNKKQKCKKIKSLKLKYW